MDKRLWNAIQELMDAADYTVTALDRYADYVGNPFYGMMEPNAALSAQSCLKDALDTVEQLMPPDPETDMEKAIARAEYEEDR